ncbi:fatty acid oxidation complex subunit alpha FadB [Gilvimarinus sp. DA14]|uniref:fatty acid oxidation complex subunit alpha FadB n=1 Tax=Gilvimarinus sp. DA14 TaxID=2956798 RepID=UPI0020B75857|nr:fatty acid oxidation complex subunit alpha FadB [Gilvimarinus sp. DA14]UTF60565.1 fatty acid oxidation complex subunit alpha FadB [Gilvimarinus sp. DA14]
MLQGKSIRLEAKGDCAHLIFAAQDSVNIFNKNAVQELTQALDLLEQEGFNALLIRSEQSDFIFGADISEFLPLFEAGAAAVEEYLSVNIDNFNRLQALPFPTVALLNGLVLGGGMEMALACDFRVADSTARLGLPEVKLGIIPGWGGAVRLPRIVGADTAIEWICSGKQYRANEALTAGVVDAVVAPESLLHAGGELLEQLIAGARDYQHRRKVKSAALGLNSIEAPLVFQSSIAFVAAKAGKHYPAPLAAAKAIQKAAGMNASEAEQVELEAFLSVAVSETAASLIRIFLSDQALNKKAKQWAAMSPKPCGKAAVIGAGIMGGGIAYQSALKGVPVVMKDIEQKGLELGLKEANKLILKQLERGRLDAAQATAALTRIAPTLSYGDFINVDVSVEAVVENERVKQVVLSEAEQALSEEAVLASNTSTISISRLAKALEKPERFCGMHFFNPVPAMPLVEVIRGERTSESTIAQVVSYARQLGKKPVVVNDCPGFLVNRVLFPYFGGFSLLVKDGVDYQRIDRVMEAFGWPMGPAYLLDVVGLDTALHAEAVMAEGYPERMKRDYTSAMELLVQHKMLGQKSGSGFYVYDTDKKGKLVKTVNPEAQQLLPTVEQLDISDEDILLRMMIPMVNELARCLDEQIVESAAEADMAMLYGTGFPAHRGGVLHWLEGQGVDKFVADMQAYQHLGALYRPAEFLLNKARQGSGIY